MVALAGTLTESESAMSQITELASSQISPSHAVVVELVEADQAPAVVVITWPTQPSVIDPKSFRDAAAAAVRMFSDAHIALAAIKAGRRL